MTRNVATSAFDAPPVPGLRMFGTLAFSKAQPIRRMLSIW